MYRINNTKRDEKIRVSLIFHSSLLRLFSEEKERAIRASLKVSSLSNRSLIRDTEYSLRFLIGWAIKDPFLFIRASCISFAELRIKGNSVNVSITLEPKIQAYFFSIGDKNAPIDAEREKRSTVRIKKKDTKIRVRNFNVSDKEKKKSRWVIILVMNISSDVKIIALSLNSSLMTDLFITNINIIATLKEIMANVSVHVETKREMIITKNRANRGFRAMRAPQRGERVGRYYFL